MNDEEEVHRIADMFYENLKDVEIKEENISLNRYKKIYKKCKIELHKTINKFEKLSILSTDLEKKNIIEKRTNNYKKFLKSILGDDKKWKYKLNFG